MRRTVAAVSMLLLPLGTCTPASSSHEASDAAGAQTSTSPPFVAEAPPPISEPFSPAGSAEDAVRVRRSPSSPDASVEAAVGKLRSGLLLSSSDSCPATTYLMPALDELAAEYPHVPFAKVFTDEGRQLSPYVGSPWLLVLKNGAVVDAQFGAFGGKVGHGWNIDRVRHLLERNRLVAPRGDLSRLLQEVPEFTIRGSLSDRDLSVTKLAGMNFAGRPMMRAKLTGADLSNADLRGANLTGAYLQHANLRGAKIKGAVFKEAIFSETTCPDGTVIGGRADDTCTVVDD